MPRNYAKLLARFDAIGLNRYGITAKDLDAVERYIRTLQSILPTNVWDAAVRIGGEYGTSIIIHEVVQIRGLTRAGIQPLRYSRLALATILSEHLDVHAEAVYEEHLYLQDVLLRKYGARFEVATLVRANRADDKDLNVFRDSDIGVFLFEEERVEEARRALARLKGE